MKAPKWLQWLCVLHRWREELNTKYEKHVTKFGDVWKYLRTRRSFGAERVNGVDDMGSWFWTKI